MIPRKSFNVLGEHVDLMFTSEETNGAFSMIVQTCPPGGGPPPHSHRDEDEIFSVVEGEFELFDGSTWTKLPDGGCVYALRGGVHTFRNCGATTGKIQCVIVPGKFDHYLEALSQYTMPEDSDQVMKLSAEYGITFVTPDAPQ